MADRDLLKRGDLERSMTGLTRLMKDKFAQPEYIPGCEILDITNADEYSTGNGWVEAICGAHNNQRVRYKGNPIEVQVGDFVDVEYFPNHKIFEVRGAGYASAGSNGLSFWTNKGGSAGIYRDGFVGVGDFSAIPIDTMLHIVRNSGNPTFSIETYDGFGYSESKLENSAGGGEDLTLTTRGVTYAGSYFGLTAASLSSIVSAGGELLVGTSDTESLHLGTKSIVALTIDSGQKVGIGTTSPSTKLQVEGSGDTAIRIRDSAASEYAEIGIVGSDGDAYFTRFGTGYVDISIQPNGDIILGPGSGKVGIGNFSAVSPSTPLHVIGKNSNGSYGFSAPSLTLGDPTTGKPQMRFFIDETNDITSIQGANFGTSSNSDIAINPNGGNVGIGTIGQTRNLTVSGSGNDVFLLSGSSGRAGFAEATDITGTAQDIIPNDAYDVKDSIYITYAYVDSASNRTTGTAALTVGGTTTHNIIAGGTTCQLRLNADGSVDIRRTAGTDTGNISIFAVWL